MIEFDRISKSYGTARPALSHVSCRLLSGQFILLSGPSGAGKSTFMKLIAALERPTSGVLRINGEDISTMPDKAIPYLRRSMGLVMQDLHLLNDRNALDNVRLPLLVMGLSANEATTRARAAIEKVGLRDRERTYPEQLSGGDQKRLAIARAIVNWPSLLLADEPTANLDRQSALRILKVLRDFHQVGVTTIVATHDESLFDGFGVRTLRLDGGQLESH